MHKLNKNILLVEPDYYTRFPPLGLLKIGRYHMEIEKDRVGLVRGNEPKDNSDISYADDIEFNGEPDIIYVTSLFTWASKPVHDSIVHYKDLYPNSKILVGGLYATLFPKDAEKTGAKVLPGLFRKAENQKPLYELIDDVWDGSIIFSSRGCIRKCDFCAVPILEKGIHNVKYSIKSLVHKEHSRIIFWDNNILGAPNWKSIFDELQEIGLKVDFNQGLDARLINDEVAEKLSKLKMQFIRIAYDRQNMGKSVKNAIDKLSNYGISPRKIVCYMMYNFEDTPKDIFERIRKLLTWGAVAYPMRYQPVLDPDFSLKKNSYISPNWNKEQLQKIAEARRIVGFAGTFPPYNKLVERFNETSNFEELIFEKKSDENKLLDTTKKSTSNRLKNAKPRYNKKFDWRKTRKKR